MSVKSGIKPVRDWSLTERLVNNEDDVRKVLTEAPNAKALVTLTVRAVNVNVEHERASEQNQRDVATMRAAQEVVAYLAADFGAHIGD